MRKFLCLAALVLLTVYASDPGRRARWLGNPDLASSSDIRHEQLFVEVLDLLREAVDVASAVTDLPGARAASERIEVIGDRFMAVNLELSKMPVPGEKKRARTIARFKAATRDLGDLKKRLEAADPEVRRVLEMALMVLLIKIHNSGDPLDLHFSIPQSVPAPVPLMRHTLTFPRAGSVFS